jgi:hypothetical protein
MTAPLDEYGFPWTANATKLKAWFMAYLLTVSAGLYWAIGTRFTNQLGVVAMFASLIPYIVCIVFAYRVQHALNQAKLYKPGAWQIIAGAFLLNPFLLGFVIPASVLWVTRRIERRIWEGKIDYQAPAMVPK